MNEPICRGWVEKPDIYAFCDHAISGVITNCHTHYLLGALEPSDV
ncbi:MAG: hypothetical protein AAF922_02725 [Pseudomonadota bacterium]